MSLFTKLLARFGIGSAHVETRLTKLDYTVGETVNGNVVIQGGNVAQEIEQIELALKTNYLQKQDDTTYFLDDIIVSFRITENFKILAQERKEIPFDFQLPYLTPITTGKSKVWLQTGLDIANGVDPTDNDFITIKPNFLMTSVLDTIEELGFRLVNVVNEKPSHKIGAHIPFIQQFEYRATGEFRRYIDELELAFIRQTDDELTFVLQVDRRAKGIGGLFSEALSMDETYVRVTISTNDVDRLKEIIDDKIRRYMK